MYMLFTTEPERLLCTPSARAAQRQMAFSCKSIKSNYTHTHIDRDLGRVWQRGQSLSEQFKPVLHSYFVARRHDAQLKHTPVMVWSTCTGLQA